jgi:hypothetical protein
MSSKLSTCSSNVLVFPLSQGASVHSARSASKSNCGHINVESKEQKAERAAWVHLHGAGKCVCESISSGYSCAVIGMDGL